MQISNMFFNKKIGMWMPDYAQEKDAFYHTRKQRDALACLKLCKSRENVIQAGGCVGFWAIALAEHFQTVHTFEPEPQAFACLKRNVEERGIQNIRFYPFALGDENKVVAIERNGFASHFVNSKKEGNVQYRALDTFYCARADAIILDVEGQEYYALKGAENLIKKFKPVVHVEARDFKDRYPFYHAHVNAILSDWGYKFVKKIGADKVYVHSKYV